MQCHHALSAVNTLKRFSSQALQWLCFFVRLPEIELVLLVERLICIKAPNPIGNIRVHGLMGARPIRRGAKTVQMARSAASPGSIDFFARVAKHFEVLDKGHVGHCEGGALLLSRRWSTRQHFCKHQHRTRIQSDDDDDFPDDHDDLLCNVSWGNTLLIIPPLKLDLIGHCPIVSNSCPNFLTVPFQVAHHQIQCKGQKSERAQCVQNIHLECHLHQGCEPQP